jgi:hypothetical protein
VPKGENVYQSPIAKIERNCTPREQESSGRNFRNDMNILATSAPPEAKEGGQGNFSFFVNPSKQSEAESP